MSTLALTHEAISAALADNLPLTHDQRAALLGLVARDKQEQATEDANALDAARYRWLRNEAWAGYNQGRGLPHVFTVDGAGNRRTMLAEEALDAEVDAARQR